MDFNAGPYLLNNPPLPATDELSAFLTILLVLWMALLVSLAVLEPDRDYHTD